LATTPRRPISWRELRGVILRSGCFSAERDDGLGEAPEERSIISVTTAPGGMPLAGVRLANPIPRPATIDRARRQKRGQYKGEEKALGVVYIEKV
jgi:hypothetical protein